MSSPWDSPAPGRTATKPKDDVDRAAENVTKLFQQVQSMTKLVPDMGTPKDSAGLRQRLRAARESASQLASETMKILQTQKVDLSDPVNKRRYTSVLERCKQAVSEFQRVEKLYLANEKQFAVPAGTSTGTASAATGTGAVAAAAVRTDNPLRSPVRGSALATAAAGGAGTAEQDVQLQMMADDSSAATRAAIQAEKEQELRAAHKDLQMLGSMLTDIHVMLQEQGVMVNEIERNTEVAASNVEAGTEDLGKARQYLNSYRCKCCILWVIIFVVVAVIVLAVTLSLVRRGS